MFEKYKKIIIAVVVIGLLFVAYTVYLKPQDGTGPFVKSNVSSDQQSSTQILGADINKAIEEIDSLDLDRSIFDHWILLRLVDHSRKINPQPNRRDNPFAPYEFSDMTTEEEIDFDDTDGQNE
jgi:hypothetical protein